MFCLLVPSAEPYWSSSGCQATWGRARDNCIAADFSLLVQQSVMLPCTHPADSWFPALGVLVPWNEAGEAEPVVLGILPSVCHSHVLELLAEVEGVLLWLADGSVILECWSLG